MTLSIETIKGVYIPKDAPSWITSKHIVDCSNNNSLQENWIPNVNDWYLCGDLWKVLQIKNMESYYFDPSSGSPGTLSSDRHINSSGKWPCDTYISPR